MRARTCAAVGWAGWLALLCLTACFRSGFSSTLDRCADHDCSGHGVCVLVDDTVLCDCDPGYHPGGDLECLPDGTDAGGCEEQALRFSGSQFVEVPDAPALDGLAALTIEAWFMLEAARDEVVILSHCDHPAGTGYVLLVKNGYPVLRLYSSVGPISVPPYENEGPQIEVGRWYHLAGTYDGDALRLFLDGLAVAEREQPSLSTSDCARPLRIGAVSYTETQFQLVGLIDEVRLSSVARYTGNFVPDRHVADAQTLALWHLDDPGQRVSDEVGTHHGTLGPSSAVEDLDPIPTPVPCIADRHGGPPSCQALFGMFEIFTLCQETENSCIFYTEAPSSSCQGICAEAGSSCLGAHLATDDVCSVGAVIPCTQADGDKVCVCSRP